MDFKAIPIYIISYNRIEDLKKLIERLEKDNYTNINIIDNASSNKDLLDYLQKVPHRVHFMDKNYGHRVFWSSGRFNDVIENEYYVLTDPDVIAIKECPDDYVEYFYEILQKYPEKTKVGFSLKLDDIPDSYANKYDNIRWESFFYETKISIDPILYDADLDTTFALYRPGFFNDFYSAIRTAYPYTARHLGWYVDTENLSETYKGYYKSASISCSSAKVGIAHGCRCGAIYRIFDHDPNFNFFTFNKKMIKFGDMAKKMTVGEILKTMGYLFWKKVEFAAKRR